MSIAVTVFIDGGSTNVSWEIDLEFEHMPHKDDIIHIWNESFISENMMYEYSEIDCEITKVYWMFSEDTSISIDCKIINATIKTLKEEPQLFNKKGHADLFWRAIYFMSNIISTNFMCIAWFVRKKMSRVSTFSWKSISSSTRAKMNEKFLRKQFRR